MQTKLSYKVIQAHRDRIFDIEVWDNGIIFFKADANSEVSLSDCEFNYNFLRSKYDGKNKHLILTETSDFTAITKEAREYSVLPENNKYTRACAVIVHSLASKIVLNFIMYFIKQQAMDMKMFNDKEMAIEWLLSYKSQ